MERREGCLPPGEDPHSTYPMFKVRIGGENSTLRCSLENTGLQRDAEKGEVSTSTIPTSSALET